MEGFQSYLRRISPYYQLYYASGYLKCRLNMVLLMLRL